MEKLTNGTTNKSSLEKWYSVIDTKDEMDYSVEDICRMLRQDYLVERAVQTGIKFLQKDPFIGGLHSGELIKAFIFHQKSFIYVYHDEFEKISSNAHYLLLSSHTLLERLRDEDSVEETKQLITRLDNILNGKEPNLHLELVPQTIKKHFELVSIGTNLANPNYKWSRLPYLPILFEKKSAVCDARRLKKALKSFSGNCKWILQRKFILSNAPNLYFLTIGERNYLSIYKCIHKTEAWEAAIKDILPLAEHLDKSLAERNGD